MIGQEVRYEPLLLRRVPRDSIVLGRPYVIRGIDAAWEVVLGFPPSRPRGAAVGEKDS
jgi:hypothetical protein